MNLEIINKIALGKKPIDFLHFEAVVEKTGSESKLVAVNILAGNKILTRIKTGIFLSIYEINQLDKLVYEIITSFISEAEEGHSTISKRENVKVKQPNKKQKEARANVAAGFFEQFNL